MKGRVVVAVLAAVVACAAFIATAAAGPARPLERMDLSSDAKVRQYLASQGIDPRGVKIQRGHRNYAGPRCPGKAWRCTRATRVVQIASQAGENVYECSPSTPIDIDAHGLTQEEPTQACVVFQASASENNTARCTEKTEMEGAYQTCVITQYNGTGNNDAFVDQVARQGDGTMQEARQSSMITQSAASGQNDAHVSQLIAQTSTDDAMVAAQQQDGDQFSEVRQTSNFGDQSSHVSQSLAQDGNAPNAMDGRQDQSGNIQGEVHQSSFGISRNFNRQDEMQNLSAPANSAVLQNQFGPLGCCSDQTGNGRNQFNIWQRSIQKTTSENAVQTEHIVGRCTSDGTCDVRQSANQNGEHTSTFCDAPTCFSTIICVEGECVATPSTCRGNCPPICEPYCTDSAVNATKAVSRLLQAREP